MRSRNVEGQAPTLRLPKKICSPRSDRGEPPVYLLRFQLVSVTIINSHHFACVMLFNLCCATKTHSNAMITFAAEYHWEDLLKACYETKHRVICDAEVLGNMSSTEKNSLINESVVQTTLHFNKRNLSKWYLSNHHRHKYLGSKSKASWMARVNLWE